jgi:hypothetical protein
MLRLRRPPAPTRAHPAPPAGVVEGRIRHVPSNVDLLQSAATRLRSRSGGLVAHQRAASI